MTFLIGGIGHDGVDPTKVVRLALQNAPSVASLMLTTQAIIAEKPEEPTEMHLKHRELGTEWAE